MEENKNLKIPFQPRMLPNQPGKLNGKRTIIISFSFFTVLLAWSYFNFKVPLLLDEIIPDNAGKDTTIGVIMALDNLVAVIVQPFFGDLSDRTKSRFGRRIPFIIVGTLGAAMFFIILPWVQVLLGLILVICLFDLFMAIFRAPSIAILPDYTMDEVRSKASAIQQFIANLGGVIGFTIPIILGSIDISDFWFDRLGFIIAALLMILALVMQLSNFKETPTGEKFFEIGSEEYNLNPETFEISLRSSIASTKSNKENQMNSNSTPKQTNAAIERIKFIFNNDKNMVSFLAAVFFLYLGFAAVEAFFSRFAQDYLGVTEDRAGFLFLAYSGSMIISAYFVGLVGQNPKIGRKRAVIIFLIWLLIILSIMSFIVIPNSYQNADATVIMIMLALIGIPWMGVIVNTFPILWGLAPEGQVGIYTGVYYTFNQLAYTLSPVVMGLILDLFLGLGLGDQRYLSMFPFIFICMSIALLFINKVKKGEVKRSAEEIEQLEKQFRKDD